MLLIARRCLFLLFSAGKSLILVIRKQHLLFLLVLLLLLLLLLLPLIHQLLISLTLCFKALMVVKHGSSSDRLSVDHLHVLVGKAYRVTPDNLLLHLLDKGCNLLLSRVFYLFVGLLPLEFRFSSIAVGISRDFELRIEAGLAEWRSIRLGSHCSNPFDLLEPAIFSICITIVFFRLLLLCIFLVFRCLKSVQLVSLFNSAIKLSTSKIASSGLIVDQTRLRIDHGSCQVHFLRRLHIDYISIHQFNPLALLFELGYQLTDGKLFNCASFASR